MMMAQDDMVIDNDSGAAVRGDINAQLAALVSNHSGATAPSTTFAFQTWADTANDLMKIRNSGNSAWIVWFKLSTGGMIKGADIASAAALPVLADGAFNDVTGTTGITSIDALGIGTLKWLQFDGALTITHHATNLILPGGKNIITAAGDVLCFYEYASGDWRLISNSADAIPYRKGADVASAAALPVIDSGAFDVTGTTTITSIDTVGVGSMLLLQFDGIITVTHHATNLILPDATNITTVAGQILVFHEYASGDWRLVSDSIAAANGGSITRKVLSSSYDISTASGTQDITGFGFDPTTVFIFATVDGTDTWSKGFTDFTTDKALYGNGSNTNSTDLIARAFLSGGTQADATASAIADGIRLTWAKSGSPTGTFTLNLLGIL